MQPNARAHALTILNHLAQERNQTLDFLLEKHLDPEGLLPRQERSLANAIIFGVLRWQGRLDWIIDHYSKTPLAQMDPVVKNILRIALFQIVFLDRIPTSAAVHTAVELSKPLKAPWLSGFINAVLRKAATGYAQIPLPDPADDPATALAVSQSFPRWLVRRWLHRLGYDQTLALCQAINLVPGITLRANTLKTTRSNLAENLRKYVSELADTGIAPDGLMFHHPKVPLPEMPVFKAGYFQVQDEAAQLVTLMLDPQPGECVLDACAGMGGKTGYLAQLMKNQGRLVALDKPEPTGVGKQAKLELEMVRLGIDIVTVLSHDLQTPLPPQEEPAFDRVLLDAPCSGLGVLRRNPDIKWSAAKRDLKRYQKRQITFLNHLAPRVKPGGLLVYAVCSTEPEENEAVVNAFLAGHPDFKPHRFDTGRPSGIETLIDANGFLRTWPHCLQMDGFFSARFKRTQT